MDTKGHLMWIPIRTSPCSRSRVEEESFILTNTEWIEDGLTSISLACKLSIRTVPLRRYATPTE